jgi:hypothetical protein
MSVRKHVPNVLYMRNSSMLLWRHS